MQFFPKDTGWVEVICGPMFSGKTEALISRVRRALFAKQSVQIFKPHIDQRFSALAVVSHSQQQIDALPVVTASEMIDRCAPQTQVVAIDEAQFFDRTLVDVVQIFANRGLRVIAAGLDQDFKGTPFEPMPELLAIAEFVTKTLAICVVCGNPAGRTQRLSRQSRQVVIGAHDCYEARCRKCHNTQPAIPAQGPLFPHLFEENYS